MNMTLAILHRVYLHKHWWKVVILFNRNQGTPIKTRVFVTNSSTASFMLAACLQSGRSARDSDHLTGTLIPKRLPHQYHRALQSSFASRRLAPACSCRYGDGDFCIGPSRQTTARHRESPGRSPGILGSDEEQDQVWRCFLREQVRLRTCQLLATCSLSTSVCVCVYIYA